MQKSWCDSSKAWGGYAMGVGCLSKAVIHYLIGWSESLPLCTQGPTGELWQQNKFLASLLWSLVAQHRSQKSAPPPKHPIYRTGTSSELQETRTQGGFSSFLGPIITRGSVISSYTALHHQEFSCGFLSSFSKFIQNSWEQMLMQRW